MTERAKEARREYRRKWARENRHKQRIYEERHWEKVARIQEEQGGEGTDEKDQ